ncbi:MAG: serine/threonine-protein kinase, partial [Bacteroidota bacterium]
MPDLKQLEIWFIKAFDLPEGERVAFLEKSLSDQPELLSQVLELVKHNEKSVLTELKEELSEEVSIKPEIDKYTLGEELGQGGMAIIYRGERADGVFDHEVAIKVLKSGLDTEDFIQRFSHERNMLGRLKHENIASIYDGGLTKDGRPYFVMEIVKGQDILSYADTENLTLLQRLELFLKVCDAIQYAHQNLIIHTDIKPSNVLVNERGEVKLTDFGIAQLLEAGSLADDSITQKNVFTPGYASPEQLDQQALDIRTDVYQLGMLLKELAKETNLPKDVRLILFRAIQQSVDDRYASVEDLRRDVENFLNKRPLEHRKTSISYVFGKYVQRNKIAFTIATVAILAIAISTYIYIDRLRK